MKIEDWPNHDRQAWETALTAGGLFDDDGAFAHWSLGTERLHRQHYGQWLSFVHRKHPALINDGIGDRVTLATVQGFVEDARTRLTTRRHPRTGLREGARPLSLQTVADLVRSLYVVLRGLEPATEWTWLRSVANKLYQRSDPYRLKPPIPITAHQLYHWSLDRLQALMNEEQLDPFERATAFRQALMIGILIWAPVRCRALMAMTVSGHVNRTSESYWLRFRAEDMKDKRARSYLLPEAFVGAMERYLQEVRPILLQGNLSDALWISRRGNPMSEDSFSGGLVLVTKREFGCELSPHSFRHIAATTIAECAPEHANIIRDVLGHATLAMAEKHYNRATGQKACAVYQAIITSISREARKRKRRRTSYLERRKKRGKE
ncbi:tyrosine-type recombinase/integrase [Sedimentimonas flavescens]|uniref:Tyrosine-type recombinase/integrase n=1 Tax=Sedimentimonas flavescens TaxID=2851012 RepID=A0ABT3A2Z2_9RHOB|nr:site-specific integrase [Sedimentimonas flavescens]MCV2880369.1 tyrosine-type recombinase/integrase [Sedimentimonas flavescens]